MNMFKIVATAIVGNALEAYDFVVYGLFSTTIAENFFPQQDKLTGILSAFGIFFLGYLARPLGALFFGRIGDTLGRKPALIISIRLMAISTFAVGLLPDYHIVGVWAPLLLLVLRSLQGFSCGCELVGSIVFVVEHAPTTKRGFYGSFADASAYLGILLASLVAWVIHHGFSHAVVTHWAWRLPFVFGLLVGLSGWLMRRYVSETQLFNENMRVPVPISTFTVNIGSECVLS